LLFRDTILLQINDGHFFYRKKKLVPDLCEANKRIKKITTKEWGKIGIKLLMKIGMK
jgi:hypothetical protein